MKKHRPIKRKPLLTCPKCGVGGFIHLQAHHCKKGSAGASPAGGRASRPDFELLAPNESLTAIEAQLAPVLSQITKKTEDLLYDLISAGLFFLKAQEAHRCLTLDTGDDGQFVDRGDGGFRQWLQDKYPRVSRASVYNYINGAKNCGLTSADGLEAIDKLRAQHALAGKTASEIYRLKGSEQEQEQENEQGSATRYDLVRDSLINLRTECESVVTLRESMSPKAYSTACGRLQRTLEELTQAGWAPAPDRKPGEQLHFKEHGDVYELGN